MAPHPGKSESMKRKENQEENHYGSSTTAASIGDSVLGYVTKTQLLGNDCRRRTHLDTTCVGPY